jgi:inosose dehydratase
VLEFEGMEQLPFERVLDEMVLAGYHGTELGDWGFLPTAPAALREALDSRGLALLAAFVPVALTRRDAHAGGVRDALQVARLLAEVGGSECFVVLADDNGTDPARTRAAGRVTRAERASDDARAAIAEGANAVARAVRSQTGLRTVFHHHAAGFVETPAEVAELLERTDPEVIGLCLDTGHWTFGGGDPVRALREHEGRVWHVHFKDCDRSVSRYEDYFDALGQGVFCELGAGDVDFPAVLAELERQGYDRWIVVEQDVLPGLGSPLESARRNRAYLTSLGLLA